MSARRILVALDQSRSARAALEAAVEIAVQKNDGGDVELVGLYIEDQALLQAAALPVTSLIQRHAGKPRDMAAAEVERAFRIAARQARAMLGEMSERRRIKASFQVQRGPLQSEMVAAAWRFDLVSVGATGRPGSEAGSVARALIAAGPCAVLISRRALRTGEPVTLLLEPGPQPRSLSSTLSLVRPRRLRVLCPSGATELAAHFDTPTLALIRELARCDVEPLPPGPMADAVKQALARRPAGLLMIDRGGSLAQASALSALLTGGLADAILLTGAAENPDQAPARSKVATTGA